MKVFLLSHTAQPEKIVAGAARLCYSDAGIETLLEGMDDERARDLVEMLSELGHESPTEHVSFTFGVEGVSRALLAQLTRHRIASYSVQSQRYVRLDDFRYVTPPAIAEDPELKEMFELSMRRAAGDYQALCNRLSARYLAENLATGMSEKKAKAAAEKQAIEDARFVLPNACETKLILTMNARELNHFFRQRCCNRAQWEIRALAEEMLRLAAAITPSLFKDSGAPCVAGACAEGKMSCGRADEVRARCAALKSGK